MNPKTLKFIIPGAVIMSVFQIPALVSPAAKSNISPSFLEAVSTLASPLMAVNVTSAHVRSRVTKPLAGEFFGAEVSASEADKTIDKQIEFVRTRKAYPAAFAVVEKHEKTIKDIARNKNVPEDVAIGVALLENGGSETARSGAGAVGIFQLMPGTAKSLGLTVSKKLDERRNPALNIEAGIRYLSKNFTRFGDWGLATWAYHAGEGNVVKALKIYARRNHGIELPGLKQTEVLRDYVEKNGITIHKLLSDPAVKVFTRKLNDDSAGYPYKVVATATLFREAN